MKTVVLGAGITGLSAAYKTKGTIYEATSQPGGICMSYYKDGYRFENGGGHWIFGANEDVLRFILNYTEVKYYERSAGVYINKIYPYPIQNHFSVEESVNPDTMKEWLFKKFGSDLCRLFFFPFNDRYTSGLYNYVAPQDEYKNPTNSKGYNSRFMYPMSGLDRFITKLATGMDIQYNCKVQKIHPAIKQITFASGKTETYDRLISTLPLNTMCKLLDISIGEELPYTSTIVMNIGATKGKNFPTEHWLYTPMAYSGFHRVGFYSNVDKSFAPKNRVSLYVEWSYLNGKPNIKGAVKELKDWGFIKKVEVEDVNEIETAYTYQWPNSQDRSKFLDSIANQGITMLGRYGKWNFQGIGESLKEGLSCCQ